MDFETRTDFANHLREHQQATLWACTHCGHTDESRQLVENHLANIHAGLSSGNAIVEKCILRDLSKQRCPFCNETPGAIQFVGHLCHHLEEISLAAVPQEVEIDDDDDNDGHSNQSFIRKSREGESISCSDIPDVPLLRLFRKDDHPHSTRTPSLTNYTIDDTAKSNLGMLEMELDLAADVRRELEEEDLKFPPENGRKSLVDEFDSNMLRYDKTVTPLGRANRISPPPARGFKCDHCPRSFNRSNDLKRHKRIHLAVKPFPCGYCGVSFSRKDVLKVHSSNSSP
jgi:hypothetical protein